MPDELITAAWLGLPVACALTFARPSRAFVMQIVGLLGWVAWVGSAAADTFPPSPTGAGQPTVRELLYLPIATALVFAPLMYDRRRDVHAWLVGRHQCLVVDTISSALLVVAGIAVTASILVAWLRAGTPQSSVVLPLPHGLSAERHDLGCGSQVCSIELTIKGLSTQDGTPITDRLRQHLRDLGWNDASCQHTGPFGVAFTCVQIVTSGTNVEVTLSVRDLWP